MSMGALSSWSERRRLADAERRQRVQERVEESNNTMRAIADVALELRASADRLEEVLSDLSPSDLVIGAEPADEVALARTKERLNRLIVALEEERRRLE